MSQYDGKDYEAFEMGLCKHPLLNPSWKHAVIHVGINQNRFGSDNIV